MFKDGNGSVYVIKNLELDRVKIGYSINVKNRFIGIRSQSGCEMELVYSTPYIDDAIGLEELAHIEFSKYRGIGEWFSVDADLVVEFLKSKVDYFIKEDEMYKLRLDGKSIREIAKAVGMSKSFVAVRVARYDTYISRSEVKEVKKVEKSGVYGGKTLEQLVLENQLKRKGK